MRKRQKRLFLAIIFLILTTCLVICTLSIITTTAALTIASIDDDDRKQAVDNPSTPRDAQSFMTTMKNFPWKSFGDAVRSRRVKAVKQYANQLSRELLPFLLKAPPTPANPFCQPPPLNTLDAIVPCHKLKFSRKVGILMTLDYEVDVLEIHLHELDEIVDKFFLFEIVAPSNPKPLIWEALKGDPRFLPFSQKIVHFVLNEEAGSREVFAWDTFSKWNQATRFFTSNDLVGFANADEVPYRNNVAFMKSCQLPSDPLDIGIWFPGDGSLHKISKSDHPVVPIHPFTIGVPTFWTLRATELLPKHVSKKKYGKSGSYLLGGMHMSRYAYPPHLMMKSLTSEHCNEECVEGVVEAGMHFQKGDIVGAMKRLNSLHWVSNKKNHRVLSLSEFKREFPEEADKTVKVPWYLQCNLDRYPSYKNEWDPRLN